MRLAAPPRAASISRNLRPVSRTRRDVDICAAVYMMRQSARPDGRPTASAFALCSSIIMYTSIETVASPSFRGRSVLYYKHANWAGGIASAQFGAAAGLPRRVLYYSIARSAHAACSSRNATDLRPALRIDRPTAAEAGDPAGVFGVRS